MSRIPLSIVDTPLTDAWPLLRAASQQRRLVFDVSGVTKAHPLLIARALLIGLLADRSTIRKLYTLPEHTLITLMRAAAKFTPVKARYELCSMVNTVYTSKFGHTLTLAPTVRVPLGMAPAGARDCARSKAAPDPHAHQPQPRRLPGTRRVCALSAPAAEPSHRCCTTTGPWPRLSRGVSSWLPPRVPPP